MKSIQYYYAASLAEKILRYTDNLSKTLQQHMSAAEGQQAAKQVRAALQELREEKHAKSF